MGQHRLGGIVPAQSSWCIEHPFLVHSLPCEVSKHVFVVDLAGTAWGCHGSSRECSPSEGGAAEKPAAPGGRHPCSQGSGRAPCCTAHINVDRRHFPMHCTDMQYRPNGVLSYDRRTSVFMLAVLHHKAVVIQHQTKVRHHQDASSLFQRCTM